MEPEDDRVETNTKKLIVGTTIGVVVTAVLIAGITYYQKRQESTICPAVMYGDFKNPQTGEIKTFEGCEVPPPGWKRYWKSE